MVLSRSSLSRFYHERAVPHSLACSRYLVVLVLDRQTMPVTVLGNSISDCRISGLAEFYWL